MSEQGFIKLYRGRIFSVDRKNWSCTVLTSELGPVENVPVAPIQIGTDRKGAYYLPQKDSLVYMACFANGQSPFILCGAPMAKEEDETVAGEPNYSFDRDYINPGDFAIEGGTAGKMIVRNDGTIEIGAGPMSQRIYIPIKNIIRDICKNLHIYTAAGSLELTSDETTYKYGTVTESVLTDRVNNITEDITIPKMPAQFKLNIKEFVQDGLPSITLEMGRLDTIEAPLTGGVNWQDIILRFLVNGPDGNTIGCFMDRQGVVNFATNGSQRNVCKGVHSLEATEAIVQNTEGPMIIDAKAREITIQGGNDTMTVNGNVIREFIGDTEVRLGANLTITGSPASNIELGSTNINVQGELAIQKVSNYTLTTSGFSEQVIGGDSKETILRTKSITVGNTSLSTKSMELQSLGGAIEIASKAPVPVPYKTAIHIAAGMTRALFDQTGNIYLRSAPAGPNLQINMTGCMVSNGAGMGVSIDRKGSLQLGALSGVGMGGVVTTLTHPVCFVTGLPIRGSEMVHASSLGIGAPGPRAPNTNLNTAPAADTAITAVNVASKVV